MSLVGRQIGRYRILEELGSGGMSVVYKGLDTALDREVAVKVLHPHLSGKDESRRRLAREAKAVAKLHHPNILEVFDFSSAESEDAYIITEYIRGHTLRHWATQERFDPPELAAMAVHEIAAALAHAHECGVIHRDLKPENVMVREDGKLKLMDFGIAKIIDRDDKMTMTGALVGSPAHMAPEIIEGQEAGPEADIFSLGTMLYLLVTGQLPFNAPNTTATLKRILDATYDDPRTLAPAVSDELAEIIARCLSRAPSSRYPDAGQLRDALAAYLRPLSIERPEEELCAFFAAPAAYRKKLLPRLVQQALVRARQYLDAGRPAKALSCLNHVLALDPQNAAARTLLEAMNQARRKQRAAVLWRRGALLGALAAGVLILAGRSWLDRPPEPPAGPPDLPAQVATVTRPPQPRPEPTISSPAPPEASPGPALPPPATHPAPVPASHTARRPPPRVEVAILVKPYGHIQVDDGPRSKQPLAQHLLQLSPGPHRITVSCELCEESVETIDVRPDTTVDEPFKIAARPRPGLLVFQFDPPEATVRVGQEERTARDTEVRPFEVALPRGSFTGAVEYTVSHPGYATLTAQVTARAGERVPVRGSLAPP
jgi:serine/threonine-protein kinase